MKTYQDFGIYDFTDYAEEVNGDALFKINGGAQVENFNEGVAGAQVGDTIIRNDGTEVTLTQGDITWAQEQVGAGGNSGNTGSTGVNSQGSTNSNYQGSSSGQTGGGSGGTPSGDNSESTSASQNTSDVPEEIRTNPQAYAYYMAKQAEGAAEGNSDKYKGYNVLGGNIKSKDIVSDTVINKEIVASNKVYQFGIGVGVFFIGGLSVETGVLYSEKDGFDLYVTGGIGVGVGISGDLTIGASWSNLENKTLHNSTSNKAVIGAVVNTTYDLDKNAKIDGVGGIGFGGGVLWTGTRTLKGSCQEIVNIVNSVTNLF